MNSSDMAAVEGKEAIYQPGVAVNQEVGRQRGTSLETFATFFAFKQLLCTVYCPEENIMLTEGNFMTHQLAFGLCLPVLTETDFMTKCFVAYFTRERSEIILLHCMYMFEYVSPASIVTPPNMNLWKENVMLY